MKTTCMIQSRLDRQAVGYVQGWADREVDASFRCAASRVAGHDAPGSGHCRKWPQRNSAHGVRVIPPPTAPTQTLDPVDEQVTLIFNLHVGGSVRVFRSWDGRSWV